MLADSAAGRRLWARSALGGRPSRPAQACAQPARARSFPSSPCGALPASPTRHGSYPPLPLNRPPASNRPTCRARAQADVAEELASALQDKLSVLLDEAAAGEDDNALSTVE